MSASRSIIAFGEEETNGEIFEVLRRRHHHGEGRTAEKDLNRRLDRDRPQERRPDRAGDIGKRPRLDNRRRASLGGIG